MIMHWEYVGMCLVWLMNVPVWWAEVVAHAQQVHYLQPNLELNSPTTLGSYAS